MTHSFATAARAGWLAAGLAAAAALPEPDASRATVVHPHQAPDSFGNTIPDFSLAGYRHGGVPLPLVPVAETLRPAPGDGDDSTRIQAAIDRVARLRKRPDSPAAAVLLTRGGYRCGRTLRLPPGVVLRGEGQDPGGTEITATMGGSENSHSTLIRIEGSGDIRAAGAARRVLDERVPLGSRRLRIEDAGALRPGDLLLVERAASKEWIHDLKMDQIKLGRGGHQWQADDYRVRWTARVESTRDGSVLLDSPVLCSIESRYGGAVVRKAEDTRTGGAGVENLRLVSVYQQGKENSDEAHAWNAIAVNRIVDCWVRNVTARHFAYSCVSVGKSAARVTVQDCAMIDPVSKIAGGRRYSFVGGGPHVLFQRCYARNGRHDFVTGHLDTGPTVFLDCLAEQTHADIGPHHRWACGQLYDNVKGGAIHVQDRGGSGTGHGWAGNCQVLWNCEARSLICQKPWPPGCQNWMIGCSGKDGAPALPGRPAGLRESHGHPVAPRSLYLAQLAARCERAGGDGQAAVRAVTTLEQRQGTVWEALHQRYAGEP